MIYRLALVFICSSFYSFGQTEVLNETFENGIPTTWKIVNQDNLTPDASVSEYTNAWIPTIDPFDTTNHCASATSFFTTSGSANRWLVTPSLNLANYGNILRFKAASYDPSFPDNYSIKIGTDTSNLSAFETILTFVAEAPYWSEHSLNLDTLGYNNQTVYIAFVLNSNNGYKLFLDDVKLNIEDPVSTDELTFSSISIYPNPTTDYITVQTGKEGLLKEVYSIEGKKVTQTSENRIDLRNFNSGVYFVKVVGLSRLIKVVKE